MKQLVKWQVILNPHAGCGKGLKDKAHIINVIRSSGIYFDFYESAYAGHIFKIAKELAQNGETHFILAGGDGTLNEAVNGIFNGKQGNNDRIVIGVIPVGTGNDWIRTFGIPDNYQQAMDIILRGKTLIQDVGLIHYKQGDEAKKRFFVNIAGFGFDAMVASFANDLKNRGMSGIRVYLQSFLLSYLKFKPCKTSIIIDEKRLSINLFSISVGIGKYNGGGMMQVPDANPVNGNFHITIIRKISVLGIIQNFKKLYNGTFITDKRVSTHVGKHVIIKAAKSLPGEADGESLGEGSFQLQILPHQLKVICGEHTFS